MQLVVKDILKICCKKKRENKKLDVKQKSDMSTR